MTSVTAMPGPPPQSFGGAANFHAGSTNFHDGQPKTTGSASSLAGGPVAATLKFFEPPADGSVPFNFVEKQPEGQPQFNFGTSEQEVQLTDIRGSEDSYGLDKSAFATLKGFPAHEGVDWDSDESIKANYYPEVERILMQHIPGSPQRVFIFDHTVRKQAPNAHRAPVNRAHIDQTPRSARQRVEFHCPEEAAQLLQGRYRLINVWRPLNGAVESFPLAFADSRTVPADDVVGVEHRYPTRTGETAGVRHSPHHNWHYWSGMDNDERLLLQCFDSEIPLNRVPHSAFEDPRTTPDNKPRQSIEVRALVFG